MKIYEIEVRRQKTSYSTLLPTSNTIFGAICWAVKDLYGREELEALLDRFDDHPPFAVTSLFPSGKLPIQGAFFQEELNALLKGLDQTVDGDDFEKYNQSKKLKKIQWIDVTDWEKIQDGQLSKAGYLKKQMNQEEREVIKDSSLEVRTRNQVNRLTGSTQDGQLFYGQTRYFPEDTVFHFYFASEDESWMDGILKYLEDGHLGGDKSIGMNRYHFKKLGEVKPKESDHRLVLSRYIPNQDELDISESIYAIDQVADQTESRDYQFHLSGIKAPITYIQPGSVIKHKKKGILGRAPVVLTDESQALYIRSNGTTIVY